MNRTRTGIRFASARAVVFITIVAAVLIGAASGSQLLAQETDRPAIQGRLLDEAKHPLAGLTLRVCEEGRTPGNDGWGFQGTDADGAEIFLVPDRNGSQQILRRTLGGQTTYFLQYRDSTWANADTDGDGRFVFDGELPFGVYCLAAQSRTSRVFIKLSTPSGEPIKVDLTERPPKVDLGELIVHW